MLWRSQPCDSSATDNCSFTNKTNLRQYFINQTDILESFIFKANLYNYCFLNVSSVDGSLGGPEGEKSTNLQPFKTKENLKKQKKQLEKMKMYITKI